MENIQKISDLIAEKKILMRFKKSAYVKEMDNDIIANKLANTIVSADNYIPMTALAGRIGTSIIGGYEDENTDNKTANKQRIQCGLAFIRILIEDEKVTYERNFKTGVYFIKFNSEWLFNLTMEVPVSKVKTYNLPQDEQPRERYKFDDFYQGKLVSNIDRDSIHEYHKESMPLVYKQINMMQKCSFLINNDVKGLYSTLKKHDLFTFETKKKRAKRLVDIGELSEKDYFSMIEGWKRDFRMTLEMAEERKNNPFWYHWNLDRRGRFYIQSSYLNPQGSKLSKSLIYSTDQRRLGKDGYFWLCVHTANCIGFDKIKIDDRFNVINDNIDFLLAIASDMSNNVWFWSGVEDPFGTAAALLELHKAHQLDDPTDFVSGLIMGFDATTSGLQIFAMLGRDEITGKLSNLTDSDEIGDSYLYIADKVWEKVKKSNFWYGLYEKRRKLVKRSVMTFLYSCGASQMGESIYSDFKTEIDGLTESHAKSLGRLVYNACKEHLPAPAAIMKLLQNIGEKEARQGRDLRYIGMSNGFKFIQKCRQWETDSIKFKINDKRIRLKYRTGLSKYMDIGNVIKGSSPNFIHFLDGQLVSELIFECKYFMIPTHDCFYTIPTHAGRLYEDSRICFNRLFGKRDLLKEICREFDVEDTIKRGSLNPDHVLDNQYCFS